LPTHPMVRSVEASIANVESQLKSIAKEIPGEDNSVQERAATTESKSHRESPAISNDAIEKADAEFRQRSDELEAARQKHAAAKERECAARQQQQKAEAENIAAITTSPEIRSSALAATTIYLSGLVSISIGLVIASFARVTEATFRTAADVRQKLGLTVLGFISRRPGETPEEKPRIEPHWVSRFVLVAGVVVAASIACLVAASLLDPHFCHSLLENPLAACSQKFWC
jgi:hypothetical protein